MYLIYDSGKCENSTSLFCRVWARPSDLQHLINCSITGQTCSAGNLKVKAPQRDWLCSENRYHSILNQKRCILGDSDVHCFTFSYSVSQLHDGTATKWKHACKPMMQLIEKLNMLPCCCVLCCAVLWDRASIRLSVKSCKIHLWWKSKRYNPTCSADKKNNKYIGQLKKKNELHELQRLESWMKCLLNSKHCT